MEGDVPHLKDPAEPFPAYHHDPGLVIDHMVGQLANTPPGEGPAQGFVTSVGRLDDGLFVVGRDPAGTATHWGSKDHIPFQLNR